MILKDMVDLLKYLKLLTGGDNLRFEEKNKNVGEPFVYTGMVMVCANEPIQTTDNTSGLN